MQMENLVIRQGTGKPVEMTMCTTCTRRDCTPVTDSCWRLSERSICAITQGFEPATLDLTDVKSKILPLSYGYWSKILALEPT